MFGSSSQTIGQLMALHDLDRNKELDYAEFERVSSMVPGGGGGSNQLLKSAPTVQQLGEKIDAKGSPKWLILALTFQPPPNYNPSNYAYLLTETQTTGTTGGPPSSAMGGQNSGSVSQPSCTDGPFTNGTLILSQVASYSRQLPTLFVYSFTGRLRDTKLWILVQGSAPADGVTMKIQLVACGSAGSADTEVYVGFFTFA